MSTTANSAAKRTRFAIIGTNFITGWFIEAALQSERFEWTAICSRSRDTASEFVSRFSALTSPDGSPATGSVEIYTDLEALAGAENVDAVYIASPTSMHAEQSIRLLRAGKHVLCEKPVASNLPEWSRMLEAAAAGGALVMEAMRPVHNPGFQTLREALPTLGRIRKASLSYCQYSSRYDKFKNGIVENAFKPEFSNGALTDIGVYCVAMMVGLFGMPQAIHAFGWRLPDSIDGMGSLVAMYDGMMVDVSYSKICDSRLACEIQGEAGTLSFGPVVAPQEYAIRWRNGTEEKFSTPVLPSPKDMLYETEAFIDAIMGETRGTAALARSQQISEMTMTVLDDARRQIGIVFPADG